LVLSLAAGLIAGCGDALAMPFFPHHPPVVKHRTRVGEWQLDVARNDFSGEVSCRLRARNKRIFYQAGAIGFQFKRKWDVQGAVYRLDRGEARRWSEDLPELVRLGAPIDSGGLENASAGIVWLPWSRLRDVNSIAIQPRNDRKPSTFHLRGVRGLYDTALMHGCSPDSRFVR
jgi:hypothetical protein